MSVENVWAHVGRLADVLQILTVVGGLAFVGFAVAGVDIFTDSSDQTRVIVAAVLGISSPVAVITGVVRAQQPDSGFREDSRATNRMLYTAGAILFALAPAAVALVL